MVRAGRVLQPQLNLHSFDVPSPLGYNKIKFIQNAQASLPAPACGFPVLLYHEYAQYGDLTEVWRTRPERTMSGVVRGMAESSVPGWRVS